MTQNSYVTPQILVDYRSEYEPKIKTREEKTALMSQLHFPTGTIT